MTLQAGTRIGAYEVTGVLGAGGMGEVYRARDSKLHRDVALKILPDGLASDPDRLARFRREAQVLASLNHPHIAQIYGFEDGTSVPALVMELVEGPTLAQRIGAPGQGLPLDQSLAIARQIADALDAAHALGIVHRDLKPANVKVKDDGTVKVLDFGLAKALDPEGATGDPANSPTITSPALTRHGVILGTAAYMAPEQARGRPVDRRADIWAFGCVLYEMLTGRLAFHGDTVSDTIAAILTRQPDWTALPDATPSAIRRLLRRCLEKDLRQRLRDIGDAWHEANEPSDGARDERPVSPAGSGPLSRSPALVVLAACAVVAALSAGAGWYAGRRGVSASAGSIKQFDIAAPALKRTASLPLALSPDGTRLAYLSGAYESAQVFVYSFEAGTTRRLEGTLSASVLFFSPDGRWLAFSDGSGVLKKIPVDGGPVVSLCSACPTSGGTWTADGTIFLGSSTKGLSRVSAEGGQPEMVTALDTEKGETGHAWPQVLPGGTDVLFTVLTSTPDAYRIAVESLASKNRRVLVESGAFGRYLPTGHLIYAQAGTLFAAPLDLGSRTTGPAVPLVDNVSMGVGAGSALLATSNDGTLAVVRAAAPDQRTLVWVNRHGVATPIKAKPMAYWHLSLSPDGTRLVAGQLGTIKRDLWLYQFGSGTFSPITSDGKSAFPEWSPDGTKILYVTGTSASWALRWQTADGSHPPELLFENGSSVYPGSLTRDGHTLVFMGTGPSTRGDINVVDLRRDPKQETPLINTPATEWGGRLSPDEHAIAYVSNESGRWEVYVQAFPGPGRPQRVSVDGGAEVVWARRGKELFYRNGPRLMAVAITTSPQLTLGVPQVLFEGPFLLGSPGLHSYDVSPDGQRFVMIQQSEDEIRASSSILIRLNWFDQLKARVPKD